VAFFFILELYLQIMVSIDGNMPMYYLMHSIDIPCLDETPPPHPQERKGMGSF
jgi:hypothetical protein